MDSLETSHDYQFTNEQVDYVSSFLQGHMARKRIRELSADECAVLLNSSGLLKVSAHPKAGFRFRQMLRDGHNRKIHLVEGAVQAHPRARWTIHGSMT